MMALESKRAYDNLHILHPVLTPITLVVWMACDTHYTVYTYAYIYTWYISYTRLVDSCNFQDLILWNYLFNCNETYTCYKGGCVELIY